MAAQGRAELSQGEIDCSGISAVDTSGALVSTNPQRYLQALL